MSEWKPIGSRIPSHFDAGRIAGLREAAEIVSRSAWRHEGDDAHSKGMDRGAREQNKADYDAILARIAELEKP